MTTQRNGFMGWGIFLLLAIVLVISFGLWAGAAGNGTAPAGYYGYRWFFPFGFFFFPFGFLFFWFFLFLVFRLVFWRGGWGYGRGHWGHRGYWGDATEILRERYAKGEITREQFEQMMRDLEQHR